MNLRLFLILCLFTLSACSYKLQGRGNPWQEKGVEKVYIKTLTNNSLRPGIETTFTSALVKEFSKGKRIQVVSHLEEADAYVEGTVDNIGQSINQETTVPQIATDDPLANQFSNYVIATEYLATATITVRLVRRSGKEALWAQSFTQSKLFPGNNRLGMQGNTSMLINDSQHQMALSDISSSLANDAYDAMLEAF